MADPTSTKSQLAAAFMTVVALVVLLALGGIWVWRAGRPSASTTQQSASGPVAKLSTWIEPPPAPPFAVYERTLLLYERSYRAATRVGAVYQYRQLSTGADKEFSQFADPAASAAPPSTSNAAP